MCKACGQDFTFPNTGPVRLYCSRPECKDRRHARACWASYQKKIEREAERLGVTVMFNLMGEREEKLDPSQFRRSGSQSFSERFRDADQAALLYEIILLGDPCSYCGGPAGVGFGGPDHIDPFIYGGGGEWENLTAACRSCNSSKGDRPLLLWLIESPRLSKLRAQRRQLSLFADGH